MKELLTISNCIDYLNSMAFTYIQFSHDKNECLYFTGKDEDGNIKQIVFQPIEYDRICVSVLENDKWIILEILED